MSMSQVFLNSWAKIRMNEMNTYVLMYVSD